MYISKVAEIDLSIHIHVYFIVNLIKTYFIVEVFILGYSQHETILKPDVGC